MLLDADLLSEDLYARAQRAGVRDRWDPSVIVAALGEAERLAAGSARDEPAALCDWSASVRLTGSRCAS
jgi:hypothetical protein